MLAKIVEEVWGLVDVKKDMSNASPGDIFLELMDASKKFPDKVTYIGGRKMGNKFPKRYV